jgi:hypothetical protein
VLVPFVEQGASDDETTDDKEHLDTEVAAGQPLRTSVVDQDSDNGERPQTVEAGQVLRSAGSGVGVGRKNEGCESGEKPGTALSSGFDVYCRGATSRVQVRYLSSDFLIRYCAGGSTNDNAFPVKKVPIFGRSSSPPFALPKLTPGARRCNDRWPFDLSFSACLTQS